MDDQDLGKIWTLPCNVEVNISFNLGGKNFPVHPLDTSLDVNVTDDDGNKICVSAVRIIICAEAR